MSMRQSSKVTFWGSSRITVLVALCGTSLAYALWKWLGHDERQPIHKSSRKRKIPPGLVNTGNTCFMNALLQSFSSTTPFVRWLQQFSSLVANDTERQYLADTLLQTIRLLNGEIGNSSHYDASDLLTAMAGRGWQISCEEQDTHEFFHAIITTLSEEHYHSRCSYGIMDLSFTKDLVHLPLKQSRNFVEMFREYCGSNRDCPFRGSLASILVCGTCGHHNPTKCDWFESLSIPLGQTMSYTRTLIECLEKFMSPEVLTGVDCEGCVSIKDIEASSREGYMKFGCETTSTNTTNQDEEKYYNEENSSPRRNCEIADTRDPFQYQRYFVHNVTSCDTMGTVNRAESNYCYPKVSIKRSFRRRLCLAKLPECLCIHLQRLVWIGGNPVKMRNFVLFPEILDVTSLTYHDRLLQNRNTEKIQSAKVSNNSCTSGLPKKIHHTEKKLYRLVSVIVHVGDWSCNGHFYAYRKGITKDGQPEWIFTSDTLVRKATRDEVFSCPAYMLIYERVRKLDCSSQS